MARRLGHAGDVTAGETRDGSRVHCDSLDRGGARLCPSGLATATPQTFTWPPQARVSPTQEVRRPTSTPGSTTHRSRPISVRFEPVKRCGTLRHRFLAYSSRSRSPDPHHLTVLTRPGLVGAAPTLPGTSRIRLPPASARPLRRPDGTGLSPPLKSQRRTAHEAGTQCVRDHLQRPDHSDWQLTNAKSDPPFI